MSANPPRNDAWKPYKRYRFVLVRRETWSFKPWQGYVLDWRQVRGEWKAHVLYVDDSDHRGPICQTGWFSIDRLHPLYADPNWIDEGREDVGRR